MNFTMDSLDGPYLMSTMFSIWSVFFRVADPSSPLNIYKEALIILNKIHNRQ